MIAAYSLGQDLLFFVCYQKFNLKKLLNPKIDAIKLLDLSNFFSNSNIFPS